MSDEHVGADLALPHAVALSWGVAERPQRGPKRELSIERIVDAALDAGDAIDAALRAITKGETIRYWQKVLGPTFDA